ncbi:MAG: hypothetical protein M3388_06895 [Acidobacteriota bacterium]|nr:hypothetical protein [Acidobacteriota bacterium]
MENFNKKKFFLYLLTCSIALGALMGIWAIISGEFGDLQIRILNTTTTIVGTSVLGLACGAYLENPRTKNSSAHFVPSAGIFLAVLSAAIILWMIWGNDGGSEEFLFKTLGVSLLFGFSFAQLSLLSLARLAARFRWAMIAAYVSILTLAATVSAIILFSQSNDNFFILRFIGVLTVVDAAVTVMIPIFHRLSRTEFVDDKTPSTNDIDAEIANLKAQISRLEKQKQHVSKVPDES